MNPGKFIAFKDKKILVMDFTNALKIEDVLQRAEEIKKFVAINTPHSLLALVDFSGMNIDNKGQKIIQEMAAHNRPYVRFIALVGLGFFRGLVFKLMLKLSGRKNHKVFTTRIKALEWLGEMI
jgi:CRISPR/Cas system endoribonuclease Cas6 (RAMP superfamily)